MKNLLFVCIAAISLFGCNSVDNLGKIGQTQYYALHVSKIDGPNVTMIVAEKDGDATVVAQFGGAGILTGDVVPSGERAMGDVFHGPRR